MYLFVVALHVVLCVFLVLIIILQPGKGGDVGAAFGGGGGSSTVFGPRGPAGLLARATTAVAVLFMVTSISLAWFSSKANLSNANVGDELQRIQEERLRNLDAPDEAVPEDEELPTLLTPADDAASNSAEGATIAEDEAANDVE
jgi:preprotein translocase subunit SecG